MATDPSSKKPSRNIVLGKYEVIKHLATGGMGAVYKARNTETDELFALKVLPPETATRPPMIERFRREAMAASKLKHPNIVRVYEFSKVKSTYYMVMELVDGIDLLEYVRKKGKLSHKEARLIVFQAVKALDQAHREGLVHRDIKPSNFLLTNKDGKRLVKLTDFGLARDLDERQYQITQAGNTVGTVDYVSPEQARDSHKADIRSDIYSLGCTFFHLLAGRAPFAEGGLTERLYKHVEEPPPDIRTFCPDIPVALERILYRMLEKDPADRYQTPQDLLSALAGEKSAMNISTDVLQELADQEDLEEEIPEETMESLSTPKTLEEDLLEEIAPDDEEEEESEAGLFSSKAVKCAVAAGAILVLGALALAFSGGKKKPENPSVAKKNDRGERIRRSEDNWEVPDKKPDKTPPKTTDPVKPENKTPEQRPRSKWPALVPAALELDPDKVRGEFFAGWNAPPDPEEAPVYRVSRQPEGERRFATIQDAHQAWKKDHPQAKTFHLEIADNGPLHVTSLNLENVNLTLRGAENYRPLLVWDLQREPESVSAFLRCVGGSLDLKNLDVVLRLGTRDKPRPLSLLDVQNGNLTAVDCTFSITGSSTHRVTLAHINGTAQAPPKAHLKRCFARGHPLVAVQASVPGSDVLIEDCLIVAGDHPQINVMADDAHNTQVRLLRDTVVAHEQFLKVEVAGGFASFPYLNCQLWDCLISRAGRQAGGSMVQIPEGSRLRNVQWRAWNCLYAGWSKLLDAEVSIPVQDWSKWSSHWKVPPVDQANAQGWPVFRPADYGEILRNDLRTDRDEGAPVGFAATSHLETIGCQVQKLPKGHEQWEQIVEGYPLPASHTSLNGERPAIPQVKQGVYPGEAIDVSTTDVGARLAWIQEQGYPLHKRIVLHLYQSNVNKNVPTSPIQIKGSDLVLYLDQVKHELNPLKPPIPDPNQPFDPGIDPASADGGTRPKDKPKFVMKRLHLVVNSRKSRKKAAMIEVVDGNLEIIGGIVRTPDYSTALIPPNVLRCVRGDLRLCDTVIQGPVYDPPLIFQRLITFEGSSAKESGTRPGKEHECLIEKSILASPRDGIEVNGADVMVRMKGALLACGQDVIHFVPGAVTNRKMHNYLDLNRSTLAGGRSIFHVEQAMDLSWLLSRMRWQTRRSVFVHPFAQKGNLLLINGQALSRGQLDWRSENDIFDARWKSLLPERGLLENEKLSSCWAHLWGPESLQKPILHLPFKGEFQPEKWVLSDVAIPAAPRGSPSVDPTTYGADLSALGLTRSKRR